MVATFILGVLIGALVGLAFCYFKQIRTVVENKDKISAGANLVTAGADFLRQFGVKI